MQKKRDFIEAHEPLIRNGGDGRPVNPLVGRAAGVEVQRVPEGLKVDPLQMAYATMVSGMTPTKSFEFTRLLGLSVPSERSYYKAQRQVCSAIVEMAEASMEEVRQNLPEETVVSIDGSWDHRRHGSNCVVSVIDQGSGKVVDLSWVSRKVDEGAQNFCANSTLMELGALKLSVEKLKDIPQITGYVHDNDARASKLIEQEGWDIEEKLDPNHSLKCFERQLAAFRRDHGKILGDIEDSLRRWYCALVKSDLSPDEREEQWMNCVEHFRGDHSKCRHEEKECQRWQHAGKPEQEEKLRKFLTNTVKFVRMVDREFSTQLNESFNREKSKWTPKEICWGPSYHARVCCPVLQHNRGPSWPLPLARDLGLPPLPPRNLRSYLCSEHEFEKDETVSHSRGDWWRNEELPGDAKAWGYQGTPRQVTE